MSILDARRLIDFPQGANASDTIIGNRHLNLTALKAWGYELYDNGTLSNGSWCVMTEPPHTPLFFFPNGTFTNNTWCFTPQLPIGNRATIGVATAVCFGLTLIPTLMNLSKHGALHLPTTKRFFPIGRRWQWYYAIIVAATAMIGLFAGVDVDRFFQPELPIIIETFFWYLMQWATMALVWEAVRHWGSWMERQFIDPNPFVLHENDRRGMFEFWLPLFFYFWLWMNFFMVFPRNWGPLEMQRSPEQTIDQAIPVATDIRFKIGGFFLFVCWLTILASLRHSIRHYEPRHRGLLNRIIGTIRYVPWRFMLIVPLALAVVAYQELVAWDFDISPLKIGGNLLAMYVGGYLPSLLIIVINCIGGFARPNEDLDLIRQRRERGAQIDDELGIVHKPAWWRRVNGQIPGTNIRDRIFQHAREVGGGTNTRGEQQFTDESGPNHANYDSAAPPAFEMNSLRRTPSSASRASSMRTTDSSRQPPPYSVHARRAEERALSQATQLAAGLLFPNASPTSESQPSLPIANNAVQGQATTTRPERPNRGRTNSSASGASLSYPAQQPRSMLDV